MPSYELALILSGLLKRPELAQALKRNCQQMLNNGSVIRKIENLGHRELPYYMRTHGTTHKEGNYFLIQFDTPVESLPVMEQELKRDITVIKASLDRKNEEFRRPCQDGPCLFGEIPDPLHEKRVYRRKTLKTLAKYYNQPNVNVH